MRRVFLALALAMFTLEVTGLFTVAAIIAHSHDDSGSACEDDCTPGCEDCACCFHPRVMIADLALGAGEAAPRTHEPRDPAHSLSAPDPREIFHVPKRSFPLS